ncbi:hypothetical protein [Streptomyces sp. NPDC055085]
MPEVPAPPVPEPLAAVRPASAAPVLIVVVPAGAVPAGSTVVLSLPPYALTDGATTTAQPPLPPYPPSVPGRGFTRRLREWNLAWWLAVAAAALEVPVTHMLTYYLHQHGLISPLEYWFPLG